MDQLVGFARHWLILQVEQPASLGRVVGGDGQCVACEVVVGE